MKNKITTKKRNYIMATLFWKKTLTDSGLLLLRVAASAMIITHGYGKLGALVKDRGAGFADPFGIGSFASMTLVTSAEFFFAIFVLLGFCTRFAALPVIFAMSVALIGIHNFDILGSGELATMYLIAFSSIAIAGPGAYSIDEIIYQRK